MAVIEIAKIIVRRGQELQTGVPQLDAGEFGWAQDTEHLYIGKRVSEGATTDQNTRILTENDLSTFMATVLNTSTAYSKYDYREFDAHIHATTSTVAAKLNNWVSLTDYGLVVTTATHVNITAVLQQAVSDLFNNSSSSSWQRADARRELRIPAGSYLITQTVELPPYTTITGEGPGLTRVVYNNPVNSLFKTVDATGADYDTNPDGMASGTDQAKHVTIKGLTLEFDNTLTVAESLMSLDNVDSALVENCEFGVVNAVSPAQIGYGVSLRGRGASGVELCKNIIIRDCKFNGLQAGVQGIGTVLRPVITDNVFENLDYGIALVYEGSDVNYQPRDGVMVTNKFRNITHEAIFAGNFSTRQINNFASNHLCSENQFYHVGNNFDLSDSIPTTSSFAVVTFLSQGNRIENSHFNRMVYAESTTTSSWFYNPLVQGNAKISNSSVYSKDFATTSTVNLLKLPLTGSDQMVTMNYQLFNADFSRKGEVVFNVTPSGYSSISDSYTFTDSLTPYATVSAVDGTSSSTLVISTLTNAGVQQLISNPGLWYISPVGLPDSATPVERVIQDGNTYLISIDSFTPPFTFTYPGSYTISKTNNPASNFSYQDHSANNYVSLTFKPSTSTQYRLEYQLDIQI